jgi:hypothetical protein
MWVINRDTQARRNRAEPALSCRHVSLTHLGAGHAVTGDEHGSTDSRVERILNFQARIAPRAARVPKSIWGRRAEVVGALLLACGLVACLVTGQYGEAVVVGLSLIWWCPVALHVLTMRSYRRG